MMFSPPVLWGKGWRQVKVTRPHTASIDAYSSGAADLATGTASPTPELITLAFKTPEYPRPSPSPPNQPSQHRKATRRFRPSGLLSGVHTPRHGLVARSGEKHSKNCGPLLTNALDRRHYTQITDPRNPQGRAAGVNMHRMHGSRKADLGAHNRAVLRPLASSSSTQLYPCC